MFLSAQEKCDTVVSFVRNVSLLKRKHISFCQTVSQRKAEAIQSGEAGSAECDKVSALSPWPGQPCTSTQAALPSVGSCSLSPKVGVFDKRKGISATTSTVQSKKKSKEELNL